jgi:thiamine kinase-like enzyme
MAMSEAEAIVGRLWPGREATIERLAGITNHNFVLTIGDDRLVLRIAGRDTEYLGIDRRREEAAARMAARAGIGAEVVTYVEPEGYLVTRFIEGSPISSERMRTPEVVVRVAEALRTIHSVDPIPGRFDAHAVVEDYRKTAIARGVRLPDDVAWALDISGRIREVRGPQALVPCHNDLLNANFIDDGERIRVVDWEYAAMGDRFFDLANFSINNELETADDVRLLGAYFGETRPDRADALRLMRFMSDFREAMWGVVQQAVSDLDVDFLGYAAEHFARLHRTEQDPAFRTALSGDVSG